MQDARNIERTTKMYWEQSSQKKYFVSVVAIQWGQALLDIDVQTNLSD